MNPIEILCFTLLLSGACGQDSPKIVPMENRIFEAGSRSSILCFVEKGSLPLSFSWLKDNVPIDKVQLQSHIEIVNNQEMSVLKLLGVKIEDQANYTCTVRNSVGSDSMKVAVFVKMPLKWVKEPKDVVAAVGSVVSIDCTATGSPQPQVFWRRNHTNEQFLTNVLSLNNVKVSDSGEYECVAATKEGDVLKKAVKVTVTVPAKFDEKYALVRAKAGGNAKLACPSTGDQLLSISWTHNDKKLNKLGGQKYEIFDHITDKGLTSEMVIRNVRREDSAVYKCKVENEYGNDERVMKLMVVEVPGAPKNVHVKETWSRSASVAWTAPHDGNSPIANYTVQYWIQQAATRRLNEAVVSSAQTRALIKGLKPGNSYELAIFAQNEVGRGDSSDSITFLTNQEGPSVAPIDINAEARGPSTIRVTFRAPPKDEWNGDLLGYYVGSRVHGSTMPFSFTSIRATANSDVYYKYEYFLSDLVAETTYDVVLKAYNAAGSSSESHEIQVQTLNANLPKGPFLAVDSTTKTSIALWWRTLSTIDEVSRVSGYILYYRRENEVWHQKRISASTAAPTTDDPTSSVQSITDYVLSDLESGSRYMIYVAATNTYGIGDPSNRVETKTSGERVFISSSTENVDNVPYYFQPLVTIPILTAFVIIVLVLLITYACVRRMKSQMQSAEAFNTLSSKHYPHLGTVKLDKSSKPLMCEPGNVFPSPYATMPMNAKMGDECSFQPWDRPLPDPKLQNIQAKNPHIYDNAQ